MATADTPLVATRPRAMTREQAREVISPLFALLSYYLKYKS
jgi:hypothetical protein